MESAAIIWRRTSQCTRPGLAVLAPAGDRERSPHSSYKQLTGCHRWRRARKLLMSTRVDAFILVFLFLIAPAGVVALPGAAAHAQERQTGKVYRIGFLRAGSPPRIWGEAFQQGLRERRYV